MALLGRVAPASGAPRLQPRPASTSRDSTGGTQLQDVDARPLEARPPRSIRSPRPSRSRRRLPALLDVRDPGRAGGVRHRRSAQGVGLRDPGRRRVPDPRLGRANAPPDRSDRPHPGRRDRGAVGPRAPGRSASFRARLPRDPSGPDRPLRLSHPRRRPPLSHESRAGTGDGAVRVGVQSLGHLAARRRRLDAAHAGHRRAVRHHLGRPLGPGAQPRRRGRLSALAHRSLRAGPAAHPGGVQQRRGRRSSATAAFRPTARRATTFDASTASWVSRPRGSPPR